LLKELKGKLLQLYQEGNQNKSLNERDYGVTWNELVLPGTERHQGQRKELSRNQKGKVVGGILRHIYIYIYLRFSSV
jgi:hypothetical protein